MKNLSAILMLATALLASQPMTSSMAQSSDGKWFVLRQETTSACWTGLLIEIDGEYAHSFALLAGGPYDTKEEALTREKELENAGTCQASS